MKSIFVCVVVLLLSTLCLTVSADESLGLSKVYHGSYVNDFANVISVKDKYSIIKLFERLQRENISAEVITIDTVSKYLQTSNSLDVLAHELFKNWKKVDPAKERVLIVLSVYDRECRILSDRKTEAEFRKMFESIILYKMIPYFIADEYSRGVFEGCLSVTDLISERHIFFDRNKNALELLVWLLIFFSVFGAILFLQNFKRRERSAVHIMRRVLTICLPIRYY